MTRVICPRCGKYGLFRPWKDGHNGRGHLVYHRKRNNEPNRCYIDPLTSIDIKADITMDKQKQQRLV